MASSAAIMNLSRRRRRRPASARDAQPDLQFLTLPELEAGLRAIPDDVVVRTPAPDILGPVLRVVVPAAATTGLRPSELLGLTALLLQAGVVVRRHHRQPRDLLAPQTARPSTGAAHETDVLGLDR